MRRCWCSNAIWQAAGIFKIYWERRPPPPRARTAAPPGPVFLDLPEPNADAIAMASEAGMTPAFETARMYAGAAPDLPLAQIYGITSFELG